MRWDIPEEISFMKMAKEVGINFIIGLLTLPIMLPVVIVTGIIRLGHDAKYLWRP